MHRKLSLVVLLISLVVLLGCSSNLTPSLSFVEVSLDNTYLQSNSSNFTVACSLNQYDTIESVTVTLENQNGLAYTGTNNLVGDITRISFVDVDPGLYTSRCFACSEGSCVNSTMGDVVVNLPVQEIDTVTLDLPPSFILGTPIDETFFLSNSPLKISFSCLANDDVGLSAVSLITNISGSLSETFIQRPLSKTHLLVKDLVLDPGEYIWSCRATDTKAQTVVAVTRSFIIGNPSELVIPQASSFDGETTDFASLRTLTNVPNVVVEDTDYGKINFQENISSLVGVDLDQGIIINENSITVNSTLYPQLNVPARLSFYNVELDTDTQEIVIEKDSDAFQDVYNLTYENGVLQFNVQNFSQYEIFITSKNVDSVEVVEAEPESFPENVVVFETVEEPEVFEEPVFIEPEPEVAIEDELVDVVFENESFQEEVETEPLSEIEVPDETPRRSSSGSNVGLMVGLFAAFVIIIGVVIWLNQRKKK